MERITNKKPEVDKFIKLSFFEWAEKHTPLKRFWEEGNKRNIENGSENYPYEYFKEIAKKKLLELIDKTV